MQTKTLIVVEMGDFLEAFGADAETLARELQITLVGREITPKGKRVPMSGFPVHAQDRYIARLNECGYEVVIRHQSAAKEMIAAAQTA
jgi:DNA mismatch repair protein MutS